MAVELMMASRNSGFLVTKMEENAVEEAASGLESVNKLIRLLSQQNQENLHQSSTPTSRTSMDVEMDCKAVAAPKFKKVVSLLPRNRTGHARFRRAPVSTPPVNQRQEQDYQVLEANQVYYATPIQQIPPPDHNLNHYPIVEPVELNSTSRWSRKATTSCHRPATNRPAASHQPQPPAAPTAATAASRLHT